MSESISPCEGENVRTLTVRVSQSGRDRIERYAALIGVTRPEAMRRLLSEALGAAEGAAAEDRG